MFELRFWIIALAWLAVPAVSIAADASLAASAERKMEYLHQNSERLHPDSRPTTLTESEINAYLASGHVRIPAGVQSLRLVGTPGIITANCRVDFDKVRAGRNNTNPLLRLFSGIHDVDVQARASGSNRKGRVQVDSVAIDGIAVPDFVLQLFVERYITPRYPGVGLDSIFDLPERIDAATVGSHTLTMVQR